MVKRLLQKDNARLLILDGYQHKYVVMMQVKTRCMGSAGDDQMALIAEVRERFP